jgi:hypothetical protein
VSPKKYKQNKFAAGGIHPLNPVIPMSIYVAQSPYRSSFSRPRFSISFPNLKGLFGRKKSSPVRNAGIPAGGGISLQERRLNRETAGNGSFGGNYAERGRRKTSATSLFADTAGKVVRATFKIQFGPTFAIVGLFIAAVLMGVMYLAHFNQVATKGYDLRRLEADRQQLMNQNDIKNMKLAEAKSMTRVIASDRVSVMKRPAELIYVRGNTVLASR